jgi:hypothetical protein
MKLKGVEEKILKKLFSEKTPWELISELEIDFGTFVEIMNNLYKKGLIEAKNGKIKISQLARKYVKREKEINTRKIASALNKIIRSLPEPKDEFDQGVQRIKDYINRAILMHKFGDLEKNIVILGDDLQGITFGLTKIPRKIVVLEIDEDLVNFINEVSRKYDLNLKAFVYDVRKKLPNKFKEKFETFVCDPSETKIALKLFLSRGCELLKEDGNTIYFTLSHIDASLKKWQFVERLLIKMNFTITDIIRNFSAYPEKFNKSFESYEMLPKEKKFLFEVKKPRKTWYKTSLIRCVAVAKPKPLVKGTIFCEEIHDDEESF